MANNSDPLPPGGGKPYVGPVPFQREDQPLFFGRTHETDELLSLITAHPVVLLYSQSGAGKTSLLNAGLVPILEESEFTVIGPVRVRGQLPEGFDHEQTNPYVYNALGSLSEGNLKSAPPVAATIGDYLRTNLPTSADGQLERASVLIFDQFEELFSLNPELWRYRRGFFAQIAKALSDTSLRVLFAMREDYIAEMDPHEPFLPEKLRTRFRLERLREPAALTAIEGPLTVEPWRELRREFAPGVAKKLIENLLEIPSKTDAEVQPVKGEFIEPVQLQVVCQAIWEKLSPEDRQITADHLEKFGDVNAALTIFYEDCLKSAVAATNETRKPSEFVLHEGTLRGWFDRELITETGKRAMVFRGTRETCGMSNTAIDVLEARHIIRAELRDGERWYELSHDRFLQPIKESYKRWLLEQPGTEQTRLRLEEKAASWSAKGKDSALLLDAGEVLEARRWFDSPDSAGVAYTDKLLAFVNASESAIQREEHAIVAREKAQAVAIADEQRQRAEAQQALREKQERLTEAERLRADEQGRRAEVERLRADEQRLLTETERRRAEEKARSSRRLRKLVAGMAVLFVLATATAIFALTQRARAARSEAVAKVEATRANQQAERATANEKLATANAKKAEDAVKVSLTEKERAEANAREATVQRDKAKQAETLAIAESERANEQAKLASQQKSKAEAALADAEEQRRIVVAQIKELEKSKEKLGLALEDAKRQSIIAVRETAAAIAARNVAQDALAKLRDSINAVNEAKSADSLKTEAATLERNRDYVAALDKYQKALAIYQKSNDRSGQSSVFEGIGRVQSYRGDIAASVQSYQEALLLLDPIDSAGRARILTSQGYNFLGLKKSEEALKKFQEALKISEDIHDDRGKYSALIAIAGAKSHDGDYKGARDAYSYALQVVDELNDDFGRGAVYANLGFLSKQEKNYDKAVEYYLKALNLYREGKFPGLEGVLSGLIDSYRQVGNQKEANKYAEQLRKLQSVAKP